MSVLIEKTLQIAKKRFTGFGFNESQIEQLLESGRKDLEKELHRLRLIIESDDVQIEEVNQTLHALKGLFYNMGNTEAGDIMTDLKNNTEKEMLIPKLKHLILN